MRDESASASSRSKRGPPLEEYHDDIYIPFLPSGTKPKAPRRGPQENTRKLTREEKIFFIHFLKHRLRSGPVPSREQLCRELAEQTPHHNADSWKRHWDKECKLPNEIYIQARKRVQKSLKEPLPAPPSRLNGSHLAGSSDEEDDSGDEDEDRDVEPGDDPAYEPTASGEPYSTVKKATKGPRIRKYRVTEVEIQAMAQYIAEKRKCDGGWDNLTVRLRWEEFAARPKNKKRSLAGWARIAIRRSKDIDAYISDYEAEQGLPADEAVSNSSQANKSVDSQLKIEEMKGSTELVGKRALEDESEPGSEESASLPQKRPKLTEPVEIVLSD